MAQIIEQVEGRTVELLTHERHAGLYMVHYALLGRDYCSAPSCWGKCLIVADEARAAGMDDVRVVAWSGNTIKD